MPSEWVTILDNHGTVLLRHKAQDLLRVTVDKPCRYLARCERTGETLPVDLTLTQLTHTLLFTLAEDSQDLTTSFQP